MSNSTPRTCLGNPAYVCTDPPYYDNIGYADLSDFFYVWLRRSLRGIHPELFSLVLTPKDEELVAIPYRFGGDREEAESSSRPAYAESLSVSKRSSTSDYPLTIFYAFRQAESLDGAVVSTGWETMLSGLLQAGYAVTGTWPMRTERADRSVATERAP